MKKIFVVLVASYLLISVARYWLADYSYAQGKITSALALSPNEPLYHIELAKIYASYGQTDSAHEQLNIVKNSSPHNVKLLKEVANVYSDLEENENENIQLQQIAKLAPTDVQNWYRLALSYGKIGQLDTSKEILLNIIAMKPDYKLARKFLANIYTSEENYDEARKQYEYILKYISPEDEEIKMQLNKFL